jgi:hypothetical protein
MFKTHGTQNMLNYSISYLKQQNHIIFWFGLLFYVKNPELPSNLIEKK